MQLNQYRAAVELVGISPQLPSEGTSSEERAATIYMEHISHAGEILGIRLLDHVIIAKQCSYSFANAGRLP